MNDEDFVEVENTVIRHEGELDLLSKRIQELEEALRVVIRFAKPNVANSKKNTMNWKRFELLRNQAAASA